MPLRVGWRPSASVVNQSQRSRCILIRVKPLLFTMMLTGSLSLLLLTIFPINHVSSANEITYQCPIPEDIIPCTCTFGGHRQTFLDCFDVMSLDDLRSAIEGCRDHRLHQLKIERAILPHVPDDIFVGTSFNILQIRYSTLVSISDEPLKGLRTSLTRVEVEETKFLNNWSWVLLAHLDKLSEIVYMKNDLESVSEDMMLLANLPVTLIDLSDNKISKIHATAFANFTELYYLRMDNNEIEVIQRSMFPSLKSVLSKLSLSDNHIRFLPTNIFSDMPRINTIGLSGNQIQLMDQKIFGPIWDNSYLTIYLHSNPLKCDCLIYWVTKKKKLTKLTGSCSKPEELNGILIRDLTPKQFSC